MKSRDTATPVTVTIVTPSYNQGHFIKETIESVLAQKGDFFLDYIVIDGGSTDNSVDVIRQAEALSTKNIGCRGIRYRWLSEKDRGQTDAIMKGFRMADGEIFGWLNSDDTYLPGTIDKIRSYFHTHPSTALVYGKAHFVDTGGTVVGEVPTGPIDYQGLAAFNLICQPAAFFKKGAWLNSGGLDDKLHYAMDHDLWIRMAKNFEIDFVSDFLATYRLHAESKTVSSAHAFEFQKEILQTVLKYYGCAPANRVYGYCYHSLKHKAPTILARFDRLLSLAAVLTALVTYLFINKGRIRREDMRMLNWATVAKVFNSSLDMHKKR